MSLADLDLPATCRSSTHMLAREVLGDALGESKRYDRAVGYFASTVFLTTPGAFIRFFEGKGTMRIVCSPHLASADLAAIQLALCSPTKAKASIELALDWLKKGETAKLLSAWLAAGRIQIQIAHNLKSTGIYHEKIGIFHGNGDEMLAVSGSTNESWSAWAGNFERVDVFPSWGSADARERANRIQLAFEDLWRNQTEGLRVLSLQDALLGGILKVRALNSFEDGDLPKGLPPPPPVPPEVCVAPPTLRLFPHQQEAIENWAKARGRGVLAMATGAGKTITALTIACRLSGLGSALCIIIVAPLLHLVDQWIDNARRFGMRPLRIAEGKNNWDEDLTQSINAINSNQRPILSLVTTQATLTSSERFKELISRVRARVLIVGDEVHNYGTQDVFDALPRRADFRLGLSATPHRHHDALGTQRIFDYFGPIVQRYGLREAIDDEVLTPYRYYPKAVGFDDEELEQYLDITRQIAKFFPDGDCADSQANDVVMKLLLKRARIVGSARQKIPILAEILAPMRTDTHILVYCGDGQVEGPVPLVQQRQIEAAVKLIGTELSMRCASYTAETTSERRRELLTEFDRGHIQVLVAIRCLDEGVDVPSTRTAIVLASSTNPRQFIQRRGRILRRFPGKERADLYDLLPIPDLDGLYAGTPEYRAVRGLVRRELSRAAEFASLATNGPSARRSLAEITERLGLHEGWYTGNQLEEDERT